ncbi:MAG: methylenetetrahydrofolate--tRNA-(uracil(54)-C(5))-methyltransferase (FADH(2)-oxidizing) TrmFO, partial [Clostridiaceae bacterium]|nr:methylenetetrahydrofolate--tRNA-(uracil(54)-C(5))-methyltransferase (FADH(2)-oxidizing) TrmFO [Clostridiaceae bacterium]
MAEAIVAGAGLAGCEAAWQLASAGVSVKLIEMKPHQLTPAHHHPMFAELVCSNSLRAARLENAVGLLKEEMRRLGSLIVSCADQTAVPAGGALAVDREAFSQAVTDKIKNHPLIEIVDRRIDKLPEQGLTIIATGPLTEGDLFTDIQSFLGEDTLHFFDAAAPIVTAESIDNSIAFRQSRYDRGGADYINCPFNEEEYQRFYDALITAELADVHDFDREIVFEGCMPIETMAKRGRDTIRFGPLKPVGLRDPRTGREPYACVQLRQDDQAASLYNIVGFQTRLKYPEQRRVFSMIPGLENAEFARLGVMHRNTFINSPTSLNSDYSARKRSDLYFAGQMTGVEGYVESAASGLLAGWQAALQAQGITTEDRMKLLPDRHTVIGAMAQYISS